MATTETATLEISSPKLAQPITMTLAKDAYPLPVAGTVVFTATSTAGSPTLTETTTMSVDIDGMDLIDNLPISKFPLDLPGELGPVLTAIATELDSTIKFAVTAA